MILVSRTPFEHAEPVELEVSGRPLTEVIELAKVPEPVYVEVNGNPVLFSNRPSTIIRAEDIVRILALASGGGSGSDSFALAATIAVMAAAGPAAGAILKAGYGPAAVATHSLAYGLLQAGITIGGMAGLRALIPAPTDGGPSSWISDPAGMFSPTDFGNEVVRGGPVPYIFGKHRLYPPHAALPMTEMEGDEVYTRMLLALGQTPLVVDLDELKIGEDPFALFGDDLEYQLYDGDTHTDPITLYQNIVRESHFAHKLKDLGTATVYTEQHCDEITIDIVFPTGLYAIDDKGKAHPRIVTYKIEVSRPGSGVWYELWDSGLSRKTKEAFSKGHRFVLTGNYTPNGTRQWAIRITHGDILAPAPGTAGPMSGGEHVGGDDYCWATLRSIEWGDAFNDDEVALLAVRVKNSRVASGAHGQVNAVVSAKHTYWNGATWLLGETSQVAAMYRAALTSSKLNPRPIALTAVDLTALQTWAAYTDSKSMEFNAVLDTLVTVDELLERIAAVGYAWPTINSQGKRSVAVDRPQTTVAGFLCDRNTSGCEWERQWGDVPHAITVTINDEDGGYVQNDATYYTPGYDENTATKFVTMTLWGCTSMEQAWARARFEWRCIEYRRLLYRTNQDIEALRLNAGDLALLQMPAALIGTSAGRIYQLETNASGHVTALYTDEQYYAESGFNYGVIIVTETGYKHDVAVNVLMGWNKYIILVNPITSNKPKVGDLVMFGPRSYETHRVTVRRISRNNDKGATLELVPHAPEVHDAGTPPAFDPGLTMPGWQYLPPLQPEIRSYQTAEDALLEQPDGSYASRILLHLIFTGAYGRVAPTTLRVEYRRTTEEGLDPWQREGDFPGNAPVVGISPVEDRETYDVRICGLNQFGLASPWTYEFGIYVVGKTNPPPDPFNLGIEGQILRWSYVIDPPRDFAGFEVRLHSGDSASWENARALHEGVIRNQFLAAGDPGFGTHTYYVKALDTSGNYSDLAASLTVTRDYRQRPNIATRFSIPWECVNWGAVSRLENCTINPSGYLVANATGGGGGGGGGHWWPHQQDPFWHGGGGGGTGPFWPGDSGFQTMRVWVETGYEPGAPPLVYDGEELTVYNEVNVGQGGSWFIEYRLKDESLGDEEGWIPWPAGGLRITPSYTPWQFRVTILGGAVQGILRQWWMLCCYDLLTEMIWGHEITNPTNPERVMMNTKMSALVGLAVDIDSSIAVTSRFANFVSTWGPKITLYDAAMNQVTGTINVLMTGYWGVSPVIGDGSTPPFWWEGWGTWIT